MGLLSILEFKHDYTGEIVRNPEEFIRLLEHFLHTGEASAELEDFGVTVRHTRHNSLPDPIEGKD